MRLSSVSVNLRNLPVLVLALSLSCCANSNTAAGSKQPNAADLSSVASSAFSFPEGLVVDRKRYVEGSPIDGVYPGGPPPDESCCWLGPKADVVIDHSASSRELVFVTYVPDLPYLRTHPENLTITISHRGYRFSGLGPGVHSLRVELGQKIVNPQVTATIIGNPWVPAKSGGDSDVRKLTVILNSVRAR